MTIRELEPDTTDTVWPRGHYGESTTVTVDGVEYVLGAGSSDRWALYSTPHGPAVVTRNYRLGYVGVELLDPEHHEHETDPESGEPILRARSVVFWQDTGPGQIGPRDTLDYTDATILRRVLREDD